MTRFATIIVLAALAATMPAAAEKKGTGVCEDDCWKKLKLNLGECSESFPNIEDPLRRACGESATRGYERCLDRCDKAASLLLATEVVVGAAADSHGGEVLIVEAGAGAGRFWITLLNGDGLVGGAGHVRLHLDGGLLYESFGFDSVPAVEIPVDLEPGAHTLTVRSDDRSAATLFVLVSDRPVASRTDVDG